jgi:hypothetical protein
VTENQWRRDIVPKDRKKLLIVAYITFSLSMIGITLLGYSSLLSGLTGLVLKSGEPLGGDFIAFYTGGRLLSEFSVLDSLYNFSHQLTFQSELLALPKEELPFLPFVYPPIVALFFLPISHFSFTTGYLIWSALSLFFFLIGVELTIRSTRYPLPFSKPLLYLGLCAFTPFTLDNLPGGQLASFGVLIVGTGLFFIRRQRLFLAGLTLALLYYKAPLYFLLLTVLAMTLRKRFLGGLLCGGVAILLIEISLVGFHGLSHYWSFVLTYLRGETPTLGYTLPSSLGVGVFRLLQIYSHYATPLVIGLQITWVIIATAIFRKKQLSLEALFSLSLIASATLSFQVNNYDLTLLIIPLILLFSMSASTTRANRIGDRLMILVILGYILLLIEESYILPILVVLAFTRMMILLYRNLATRSL